MEKRVGSGMNTHSNSRRDFETELNFESESDWIFDFLPLLFPSPRPGWVGAQESRPVGIFAVPNFKKTKQKLTLFQNRPSNQGIWINFPPKFPSEPPPLSSLQLSSRAGDRLCRIRRLLRRGRRLLQPFLAGIYKIRLLFSLSLCCYQELL